jgi:uncharacterized protein (TIGR00661 family)
MKILFAIQGTGNGHLSRARDIIPCLRRYGELDIMVSGTQVDVALDHPLAYRKKGVSFMFGKKGGVDYWKTLNHLGPFSFARDIITLPVGKYDLIINDFEPVSAWAAKLRGKPTVSLSHQCSFLSPLTPRPEKVDAFAEQVFRCYAPTTHKIGFHFEAYDDFIQTPVIRKGIREIEPQNKGHYTVYLPAYDDRFLVKVLSRLPEVSWEIFSKHEKTGYEQGSIRVRPVQHEAYNKSVAACEGLLTGGGFEAPAEALFLGKKVLAIPMKGQYEQYCNVESMKRVGGTVAYDIDEQFEHTLRQWVYHVKPAKVFFPDNVESVVDLMMKQYTRPVPGSTR